jgi:hypothetical protein
LEEGYSFPTHCFLEYGIGRLVMQHHLIFVAGGASLIMKEEEEELV